MHISVVHKKRTKPQIAKCYRRNRLFKLLDKARKKQAIWLSAFAGSGKSTLVSSYVDDRNVPAAWYRLDDQDLDVSSFFHNLDKALQHVIPHENDSSLKFGVESLPVILDFTYRYFEKILNEIEKPFILVLDNYQEIPDDSIIHKLMLVITDMMHDDSCVIFISREKAPQQFIDLQVRQKLYPITWKELQLNHDETRGIAKLYGLKKADDDFVDYIYKISQGWVTATVLTLSSKQEYKVSDISISDNSFHLIFNYLAHEFFNNMDDGKIHCFLSISIFKTFTDEMARNIISVKDCNDWLNEIESEGFFTTTRLVDGEVEYELLPIYRKFLQYKLKDYFNENEITSLKNTTLEILEVNKRYDEAISLAEELGDWERYIQIVINSAPELLAKARNETLIKWINNIPSEYLAKNSWLNYWLGISYSMLSPDKSLLCFEDAYVLSEKEKNTLLQKMSWAAACESLFVSWGKYKDFDIWLNRLDEIVSPDTEFESRDIEVQVISAAIGALLVRTTDRQVIGMWLTKADKFVFNLNDSSLQFRLVSKLFYYYSFIGDITELCKYIPILSNHLKSKQMSPVVSISSLFFIADFAWLTVDYDKWFSTQNSAWTEMQDNQIYFFESVLYGQKATGNLVFGDLTKAEKSLEKFEKSLNYNNTGEYGFYYTLLCWNSALNGDFNSAEVHGKNAVELIEKSGAKFPLLITTLMYISALFQSGQRDRAVTLLDEKHEEITKSCAASILFHWYSLDAFFNFEKGNDKWAKESLRQALTIARANNLINYRGWEPALMSKLCAYALMLDIEVDYTKRIILTRELEPDKDLLGLQLWPWKVRIFTLGNFSITFTNKQGDDVEHNITGKPLELLKAIISFGAIGVAEEKLATELWPDLEGDDAHRAMTTTLHRLRKLMGGNQMITLSQGKLGLNFKSCWVDAIAFENGYKNILAKQNGYELDMDKYKEAIELYQGEFLKDENAVWLLAPRERYRSRIIKLIKQITTHICSSDSCNTQSCDLVANYLEHGLAIDELHEDFYKSKMNCALCKGNRIEGKRLYEQCNTLLKNKLGIEPSEEIQELYKKLI